jgi:hypothetical protein
VPSVRSSPVATRLATPRVPEPAPTHALQAGTVPIIASAFAYRRRAWHPASMDPRYVVRITPCDVGRRVSVRSRTQAPPGEPSTTDTVGTLREWTATYLLVERRDGTTATVAVGDLLAGKVLAPTPPRRTGR